MLSTQELKSLSLKELRQELEKSLQERVKVDITLKTKHEKDTSKARKTRRTIARLKTLIRQLESSPQKPAKVPAKAAPKAK